MDSMPVVRVRIENLADYQVDPVRGFLPARDPLDRLPAAYSVWDQLGAQVPTLLMAGRLRSTLDRLEPLDTRHLDDELELDRAMLLLCVFGNAYVWGEAEPARRIPPGVAIPLWQVAARLGRPPIASHASVALHNWRRLDPSGPIALDNLGTHQLFLGGVDEQWFYLVTVLIEAEGAAALPALVQAQQAVSSDRVDELVAHLTVVSAALTRMLAALLRMTEQCDPYIFYHRIRRFLTGWESPGVVYGGVDDEPRMYAGGSAAQSALVQALDAGLGVGHRDRETQPYLLEMRRYMPPPHRAFIEALEDGPPVRRYVHDRRESHPFLRDVYNQCVRALEDFRRQHVEIAVRYITHQAPKDQSAKGTGGTNFAAFLGKARKETAEHEIP